MFRRSRFSVRPNVSSLGRAGGAAPTTTTSASQESPSASTEVSETPKQVSDNSPAEAVNEKNPDIPPSEKVAESGNSNNQNGEGSASSSAAVQRRKRFSVKPKVAPGRPAPLPRTPKSPVKAAPESPAEISVVSSLDKSPLNTSRQTGITASVQGLLSPRRQRPSEGCKALRFQPRPAVISSDGVTTNESPVKTSPSPDKSSQHEIPSGSWIKDVPLVRGPDKIPLSLPDREAAEISEKARSLVKSKTALSLTPSAYSLSRLLNTPSDLQRLVKAQKLRELLKVEKRKETSRKRAKIRTKEYSLDPSKMTMRDLIHYLPTSNPMTTSLDDSIQENETVLPDSPEPQKPAEEEVKEPEVTPKVLSVDYLEEADEEEEEEEDDDSPMVPQVKVAEDGSLIIDEESLTVEVQRAKGPNVAAERDPIFERGSTTTYSSFRKGSYTKPWFSEETDMFFLAVSMVGTDFTMICQLFPHRARSEIKNKFKKEERENSWRVDKAFKERRKLDIEYFSKLLEKIMDYQKNKKNLKSLEKSNAPKKSHKKKTKASGKRSAKKLSDVEEEDEEEDEELPDLEEEFEKENEGVCNEEGASKRKKKRRKLTEEETEETSVKKLKKAASKGEDGLPYDDEAALPEDHTTTDICEKPTEDSMSKSALIKPAQLSRARAPKPLLPLGRKYAKKPPKVDENVSNVQENKDVSSSGKAKVSEAVSDDTSSDEEEMLEPPKPTRYGRVPKPTKPLVIKDTHSSASETSLDSDLQSPASSEKNKTSAKKRISTKPQPTKASKKPRLITLTASQSDFSDEEGEHGSKDEELVLEQQQQLAYSSDSVFVPASLHTPQPVIPDVDESMAEFDILASMPDVLDISHDSLCPDSSCAQAQQETGSAEPFEHQLDLLVDVIDYLSSEPTEEVSETQSYNEAAETLLTIGKTLQSEDGQTTLEDCSSLISSAHDKEEINTHSAAQEEHSLDLFSSFDHELTELSTTTSLLEPSTTNTTDMVQLNTSDEIYEQQEEATPKLQSVLESPSKGSPQTKKQRMSKLKPKPNIGRSARVPQLKPNSGESSVEIVSQPIVEDTVPKTLDTFKDERFVPEMVLSAATPDQISSELNNQSFSESHCELDKDASNGDKRVMSNYKNDNIVSLVEGVHTGDISERQIEKESLQKTNIVLESSSSRKDGMSLIRESFSISQNEVKEADTSTQSEQDEIKLKPSLPQISGTDNYESQTQERPVDTDSAPVDVQAVKETSPVVSTSLDNATVITKELEPALPPQQRRSRLQKPKPKLPQISRPSRSKPGTTKVCEEHDTSTEESFGYKAATSELLNITPKDCVQTESIGFSTVTHGGTDSGSNVGSAQSLEGQDISTSNVPSVDDLLIHQNEGEVEVASQLKKTGLQKPKPIKPQKAETSRSQPESKVESVERDVIAEKSIGGTGTTSQFTDEPTSSISTESSFTNVDNSIVTEPPVGNRLDNYFKPVQVQADQDNVLDSPVSQKADVPSLTSPLRRTRLQKPKPNLPQKSRTSQSIPATTSEPEEKDFTLGDRAPTLESTDSVGTGPPVKQGLDLDLDSIQMQEGQSHSTSSISCVGELQAVQKDGEVASTSQQRRGRLQRPKPNLPQSLRTLKSKREITKLPVEKDLIPEEEIKNTEPTSSENESCFDDPVKRDLLASELQIGQCLNKDSEQVQPSQVSEPETTQESEKKCLDLEELTRTTTLSFQFTDETVVSPVKTTNVTRTESAVKEVLCEQKLNEELAEDPLGEGHDLTMATTNAEASRAQSERALTCQPTRGRFHKPKPNLSQISRRSKLEKKPDPTSNPECEVIEPTLAVDPTSGPPSDLHSTAAHSKEMAATAETKTSPKRSEQIVVVAAPSGQSMTGDIQLNENQVESVPVQATIDIISKFVDGNRLSHTSTTESNCEHVTTDLANTQAGRGLCTDAGQVQEDDFHPDLPATSVEVLPVSQERDKVVGLSPSRKSRLQRIKPKPNLSQARLALSKPGPLKDSLAQHVEEMPNKSLDSNFQQETSTTQPEALSSVGETTGASSTPQYAEEYSPMDGEKTKSESTVLPPTTGDSSNTPLNSRLDANSRSKSEKHLSRDSNESLGDQELCEDFTNQADSLPKDKSMDLEECAPSDVIRETICEVPDNESFPSDMFSKSIHSDECTLNEISMNAKSSSNSKQPNAQQPSDHIAVSHVTRTSTSSLLSAKSSDNVSPEPTDSSTSLLQVQQEKETTPAQTEAVVPLQSLDLIYQKPESDTQDPISDGGLVSVTQHSLASTSAVSSAQVASTAGTNTTQSCQGFSDFLPDQVPSDPDEPFFVLSLTAIPSPTSTSTETTHSKAGQAFHQTVTAALLQEQSVSEESSVTGVGGSVPNKPSSPGESDSKGDADQTVSSVVADISPETPTSAGQQLKSAANEDGNEAKVPSAKEKQPSTRRRAKQPTKPTTAQRKQRNKGVTEEAESLNTGRKTRKELENAGPSESKTPESHERRSEDVDLDQERLMSEEDLNSNLDTKTTKPVRAQRQKRKPKDKPAPAKSPPPTKALSKGSKTKAVREKQCLPDAAASSSHDKRSTTQGKKDVVSSPTETDLNVILGRTDQNTSVCTAEVSTSQDNMCVVDSSPDEEPITVSEFFFGDIFTEVEEKYERVPKPTKPLVIEDTQSSASKTPLASQVESHPSSENTKTSARKRISTKQQPSKASKKPKLTTPTASQSAVSDEEGENGSKDEELALRTQHFHYPFAFQDVIDYISTEPTEQVSEAQSYNEAAIGKTLQSEDGQTTLEDCSPLISSAHDKEEINTHSAAQEGHSFDLFSSFDHELTELSTTTSLLEPSTTNTTDMVQLNTSEEIHEQQEEATPKLQSVLESPSKGSPQTKKQRMSKLKPKPNIGRSSRVPQLKPNSGESSVETVSLQNVEDTGPKTLDTFKDDFSSTETEHKKTPPDSGERFVPEMVLSAATPDQTSSELNNQSFSESHCEPDNDVSNEDKSLTSKFKNDNIVSLVEGVQTGEIGERQIEKESLQKTNIVLESSSSSNTDGMSISKESLSISQNEVKEAETSTKSEQDEIKLKPSLPQIYGMDNYESQTQERPVDTVSAPVDVQAVKKTSPVISTSLEDATVITKEVELALPPQQRRSRLQKPVQVQADQDIVLDSPVSQKVVVPSSTLPLRRTRLQKPKPKLPQKSKTSQSIPATTSEPKEKDFTTKESLGDRAPTLESTDSAATGPPVKQGWNLDLDSIQMQEGQSHSTCVGELQAVQKDGEVASTSQQRRARLQRPKPNLPQSLRTLKSKHEITKLPVEKDLIPEEEIKNTEPSSMPMDVNLTSPSETESGISDVVKRDSLARQAQSERALTCQTITGRFHKPKANLSQVSRRSKSEKKADPTSNPECELTEPTLAVDREHQHSFPTSGPPSDLHSTATHSKEMASTAETKPSPKLSEQMVVVAAPSGQSVTGDTQTTPAHTDAVVPFKGLDQKPESDSQEAISDGGLSSATQHLLASTSAESSAQVASTAGTNRNQSCQGFSDFLPDQVPSDPDEPFFILSLTAIPTPTSTETTQSDAGQVFNQTVTPALVQEQSVSEEISIAEVGGSVSNKPSSPGESDSKGDAYPTVGSVVADISRETSTSAGQLLKSPANDGSKEAKVPSAKEKQPKTRRRAKPETKPTTAQRKQRSKCSTEEMESENTGRKSRKDSEKAGPSKTPESHDLRSQDGDLDQDVGTSEEDLNSNMGTKTTKPVRAQRQKRKPKDKPAPTKSPPPTKALSKGSKTKAVKGKPCVSEPAASSSHDKSSTTQGKKEAVPSQSETDLKVTSGRSDQNTSVCTAEVSASQESVCVVDSSPDEEPITVSQFFFCDIFTEVEEK